MLRKSLTALSAALLLTTSMAQARTLDRYDAETKAAATAAYSVEQNTWWDDFTRSGKKIVDHIEDVSKSNPQAAMWFLLTGGKMGFASRQATDEEATKMFSAMRNIATHFGNAANKAQGLEAWKDVAQNRAGQAHLDMIYKKIDELEEANKLLNIKVSSLEEKLEKETGEREREVGGLKGQIGALNERINVLEQKLQQKEGALEAHAVKVLNMQESFRAEMKGLWSDFEERAAAKQASVIGLFEKFMTKQEESEKELRQMIVANKQEALEREQRFMAEMKEREAEAKREAAQAKREAQEREAQAKREAQEREAEAKREAQEREAQAKREVQEREAQAKREVQEREARIREDIKAETQAKIDLLIASNQELTKTIKAGKEEESEKFRQLLTVAFAPRVTTA